MHVQSTEAKSRCSKILRVQTVLCPTDSASMVFNPEAARRLRDRVDKPWLRRRYGRNQRQRTAIILTSVVSSSAHHPGECQWLASGSRPATVHDHDQESLRPSNPHSPNATVSDECGSKYQSSRPIHLVRSEEAITALTVGVTSDERIPNPRTLIQR